MHLVQVPQVLHPQFVTRGYYTPYLHGCVCIGLGIHLAGVLVTRALLFWVFIWALDLSAEPSSPNEQATIPQSIHLYIHIVYPTHIYIYICEHEFLYRCTCRYVYTCTCRYVYVYTYSYMCTCACVYLYVYILPSTPMLEYLGPFWYPKSKLFAAPPGLKRWRPGVIASLPKTLHVALRHMHEYIHTSIHISVCVYRSYETVYICVCILCL